jgi:predicted permease
MGLLLLGASFARFTIPRPISRLPIAAILATCLAKMVIIPIIGIFIVQAMTQNGLIDKSSKVERFVAILVSGTPAAVL